MHLWQFLTKIAEKPRLHFLTNFATRSQKAKPPNFAKPKPNQDQFLLQPNFAHLILDSFATIPHQDCSKTTTSLFHHFRYQVTKSRPSHQTWLSQNPTKINSFSTKLFTPHFGCICNNSPQRFAKIHDFTFSPILLPRHKNYAKPPNLAKPKPNQDQFLLRPKFSHTILDAIVTNPHQDA